MRNYLIAQQEIENDLKENRLNIVEGWSAAELERIFNLDDDQEAIGHALHSPTRYKGFGSVMLQAARTKFIHIQ